MRVGLPEWIVLFFTRPIRLSDGAALLKRLTGKREPVVEAEKPAPEAERGRIARSDPGPARDRWTDTNPAVDVSEQPLDTLPAELQDEFRQPPKP